MGLTLTFALIAAAFAVELVVFGRRIVVLSPVTMLLASLLAMYGFPYLLSSVLHDWNIGDDLSSDEVSAVVWRLNLFLVVWLAAIIPLLRRVARRARRFDVLESPGGFVPGRRATYIVLASYLAVFFLYMGSGLSFNPAAILDRLINPRSYTYLTTGFGPLVYVKTGLGFAAMVMAAARWQADPRKPGRIAILGFALAVNVLGGTKSSIVMPFVALVLIMQRTHSGSQQRLGAKLRYMLVAPLVTVGLVATAFSMWGKQTEATGVERVVTQLRDYGREAYLSARVVADFPWSFDYTVEAVTDTMLAPVPRVIYPEKQFVGFYKKYWMPRYESGVVEYHTTTSGFVAEGHMVFGLLSPVVYAVFFAFLCARVYSMLLAPTSLPILAIGIFVTSQMYFISRTGIFGTTPWYILIPALVIAMAYVLTGQRRRRRLPAQSPIRARPA